MSDPTPASPADDTPAADAASTVPTAPPVPPAPPAPPAPSAAPTYAAPPATAPNAAVYGTPPSYPPAPQPTYAASQSYGQPAGYTQPYYPQRKTNGMAVASLVCGIGGLVFSWTLVLGLASIAAVILGHLSLKRLKTSGEAGYGMALAGTITGWVGVGVLALLFVLFVIVPFLFFIGLAGAATTYSAT